MLTKIKLPILIWTGIIALFSISLIYSQQYLAQIVSKHQFVTKSSFDHRQYRRITLDNGLPVIIVHDPLASISAASISLYSGSFFNPPQHPGLSHLLEHALFLQNKTYPELNGFSSFVQANGGSYNAYTSPQIVNYFFSVNSSNLKEALKRFSHMFIDPIFEREKILAERDIVDQEYHTYQGSQPRRFQDVLRMMLNPKHPASMLSVGNRSTLTDQNQENLEEALGIFFQQYYHPNNMALTLVSSHSLNESTALLKSTFNQIPASTSRQITAQKKTFPIYMMDNTLPRITYIDHINDQYILDIQFIIPSNHQDYQSKPELLLHHFLNNRNKGSLFHYLKAQNWINTISSGIALDDRTNAIFQIKISLTPGGYENVYPILAILIDSLKRIQSPKFFDSNVIDDLKKIYTNYFALNTEASTLNKAKNLSASMLDYSSQEALIAEFDTSKLTLNKSIQFIKQLEKNNVHIIISSPNSNLKNKSLWFNTPFESQIIINSMFEAWQESLPKSWENYSLRFNRNLFLQTLKSFSTQSTVKTPAVPDRIIYPRQSLLKRTIEKRDLSFNSPDLWLVSPLYHFKPTSEFIIEIYPPESTFEKKSQDFVTAKLLAYILQLEFQPLFYEALESSHQIDLQSNHHKGISLRFNGPRDNQEIILQRILRELKDFKPSLALFDAAKNLYQSSIRRIYNDRPIYQILNEMTNFFYQKPTLTQEEKTLKQLKIQDIEAHLQEMLSSGSVFYLGADKPKYHAQLHKLYQQARSFISLDSSNYPPLPSEKLNYTKYEAYFQSQHQDDALLLYAQAPDNNLKTEALWRLLAQMLSSDFFTDLRTKQKIGYIINAHYYQLDKHKGIRFMLQSNHLDNEKLLEATEDFIQNWGIKADHLKRYKQATITDLVNLPISLRAQSSSYLKEIRRDQSIDNIRNLAEIIDEINAIDLDDLERALIDLKVNASKLILATTESD